MDGKLLVLCGERTTEDSHGNKIISAIDLLNPNVTESINKSVLYVDWETVVPRDITPLREMKKYALSEEPISPEFMLKQGENDSIMKRAYLDMLMFIDKVGQRPRMDYELRSMEVFMRAFLGSIVNNKITAVLPGMSKKDERQINIARFRIIKALKERIKLLEVDIDILHFVEYANVEEIYEAAHNEIIRMHSKSDFQNEEEGCEER